MSKSKIAIGVLCFITLLITSYFYFLSNRFSISKERGGYSYKIDRWTGQTWVLYGDQQIKLEEIDNTDKNSSNSNATSIDSTSAIVQVKNAHTLDSFFNNADYIKSGLEDLKGNLKINGWTANKIDDQIYLVSYEFKHKGSMKGYYFEFNTNADVIRNVSNDYDLQQKYNVGPLRPPTNQELD